MVLVYGYSSTGTFIADSEDGGSTNFGDSRDNGDLKTALDKGSVTKSKRHKTKLGKPS